MHHSQNATNFIADQNRTTWHDKSVWFVREKRDKSANELPEWELLRELASGIKNNVLSNLAFYWERFELNAKRNGIQIHWAIDAKAHNEIILGILQQRAITEVVKSKSMLTEECHLNDYLLDSGINVVDTDLGERIIQLKGEPPSHIVMPAIHLKREEISSLFHEKLQSEKGKSNPEYLTEVGRQHLRKKFMIAGAAITGVNFAVAETGGVVVCTNEGNADMGVNLAPVQIHCVGIEKIIPRVADLGVFTRLLARSATGQPITVFTSHYHQPRNGAEMHIVIVDNGRTEQLGRQHFRNSLKCIRCGACMNTCPIYRRSGGHSYGSTIPGPIGSILSPGTDLKKHSDLPFASTLCGSCSDVCPVKIDIHEQLYRWRQVIRQEGHLPILKRLSMVFAGKLFSSSSKYVFLGKIVRFTLKFFPRFLIYNRLNEWGKKRELPKVPPQSFKTWYSQQLNK